MKRPICLLLFITISIQIFGQKGTITIKKALSESDLLVGQWVYIYTQKPNGDIIKPKPEDIDTLNFYSPNKFTINKTRSKENGIWRFDQNNFYIVYEKCRYERITSVETTVFYPQSHSSHICSIKNDTLIFCRLPDIFQTIKNSQYYIRNK